MPLPGESKDCHLLSKPFVLSIGKYLIVRKLRSLSSNQYFPAHDVLSLSAHLLTLLLNPRFFCFVLFCFFNIYLIYIMLSKVNAHNHLENILEESKACDLNF